MPRRPQHPLCTSDVTSHYNRVQHPYQPIDPRALSTGQIQVARLSPHCRLNRVLALLLAHLWWSSYQSIENNCIQSQPQPTYSQGCGWL